MMRILNKSNLVFLSLLFAAGTVFPAVGFSREAGVIQSLQMDELHENAPDFVFVDEQGKPAALKDFKGKAILLHFWASWCVPCRTELPELMKVAKELDQKRWVFLPISADELKHRADALRIARTVGVPFYQVKDPDSAGRYKTWGLPVTYIVSPSGQVIARALGCREWAANRDTARGLNELFRGGPR